MGAILLVMGVVILLWGMLNVHQSFRMIIVAVAVGLFATGTGIRLTLGKFRMENDMPVVLLSSRSCYRFKVKGIVDPRCHETEEEARKAMHESPRYQRWKRESDDGDDR
ncbi:MAG TPA: hypothetical protein ENJ43_03700 [Gammaproteobacteria bacterium]|nr:hypothetical protein [Gammaproteobacteria bacterium]